MNKIALMLVLLYMNPLSGCSGEPLTLPFDPNVSDKEYIIATKPTLSDEEVKASIDFLPEKLSSVVIQIAGGDLKAKNMIFWGKNGTGKSYTAKAIGQRYFKPNNAHYFAACELFGDMYENSGVRQLEVNLRPIIKAAEKRSQYVVIDWFRVFAKKYPIGSKEEQKTISHFYSLVNEMSQTKNIILVAVCNKINKMLPEVRKYFKRSEDCHFPEISPVGLYERLLKINLTRAEYELSSDDLQQIAGKMDCLLSQVSCFVDDAQDAAFDRTGDSFKVTMQDFLQVLKERNFASEQRSENWLQQLVHLFGN